MGAQKLAGQVPNRPVCQLASSPRFENLQHDLELATVQDESLLQKDLLQQEPCVCQANEPPLTPVPCNLGILGVGFLP